MAIRAMWKKILPVLLLELCADGFVRDFDEELEVVFLPAFLTLGFFLPGLLPPGVRVVEGLA